MAAQSDAQPRRGVGKQTLSSTTFRQRNLQLLLLHTGVSRVAMHRTVGHPPPSLADLQKAAVTHPPVVTRAAVAKLIQDVLGFLHARAQLRVLELLAELLVRQREEHLVGMTCRQLAPSHGASAESNIRDSSLTDTLDCICRSEGV